MDIHVLRLGHRLPRDERISTHVALVARAFGAKSIVYSGQHDEGLESSVSRLVSQWGGAFTIKHEPKAVAYIRNQKKSGSIIIHLTMYGIPLSEAIDKVGSVLRGEIQSKNKLLIIVGSEHVPGEIYPLADYNISVTGQPHSEVAALAITLDRIMAGKELCRDFDKTFKGKISIDPSENSKIVKRNYSDPEKSCDTLVATRQGAHCCAEQQLGSFQAHS